MANRPSKAYLQTNPKWETLQRIKENTTSKVFDNHNEPLVPIKTTRAKLEKLATKNTVRLKSDQKKFHKMAQTARLPKQRKPIQKFHLLKNSTDSYVDELGFLVNHLK